MYGFGLLHSLKMLLRLRPLRKVDFWVNKLLSCSTTRQSIFFSNFSPNFMILSLLMMSLF